MKLKNKLSTIKNPNDQQNTSSFSYKIRSRNIFDKEYQQTFNHFRKIRSITGSTCKLLYTNLPNNKIHCFLYTNFFTKTKDNKDSLLFF